MSEVTVLTASGGVGANLFVWAPLTVNKNSTTGLSTLSYSTSTPASHLIEGAVAGIYESASSARVVESATPGLYQISP